MTLARTRRRKKLLICTTAAVLHTPALRFAPGFFTVVRISPFCLIGDQGCLKEIFDCFFKSALGQTKPPLVHCGCMTRCRPRFFDQVGHQTTYAWWEISIFSLNHVIVRPTKIMNRADKNWVYFQKLKGAS